MENIKTIEDLIEALKKVENQKASVFILERDLINSEHRIKKVHGVTTEDGEAQVHFTVN
jgi:hypothetical protein